MQYEFVSWDTETFGPKPVQEGTMDFHGFKTAYYIVGKPSPGKLPLLVLHGGPGAAHNYLATLDPLAMDGRQVIYYDQIGCGRSQAPGHKELFNLNTWIEELEAIRAHLGLDRVHILGHSCGGQLLLEYLTRHDPRGLASAILASALFGTEFWGREQQRLIRKFPPELQEAFRIAEETGDYTAPAYLHANEVFNRTHVNPAWGPEHPACLTEADGTGTEAYNTAWGPNEFTAAGNMKGWDVQDLLPTIHTPTLITSGIDDMCTPYVAKTMLDAIPGSRWELFMGSTHCPHSEENPRYLQVLGAWLNAHDPV